jgi:CheY-specific phosphatase CheX
LLGAIGGGLVVAVATKAIPKMMSQMMAGMMQNMMAQMGEAGCDPGEM